MGCACVITSGLTVEQLDSFVKYHPEALKMWDEDRNELLFSVGLEDGPGHITEHEAVFSRTKVPGGKATITIVIDPEVEDKAKCIRERLGKGLLRLDEVEEHLAGMSGNLEEEIRKIDGMISQEC